MRFTILLTSWVNKQQGDTGTSSKGYKVIRFQGEFRRALLLLGLICFLSCDLFGCRSQLWIAAIPFFFNDKYLLTFSREVGGTRSMRENNSNVSILNLNGTCLSCAVRISSSSKPCFDFCILPSA